MARNMPFNLSSMPFSATNNKGTAVTTDKANYTMDAIGL